MHPSQTYIIDDFTYKVNNVKDDICGQLKVIEHNWNSIEVPKTTDTWKLVQGDPRYNNELTVGSPLAF